MNFPELGELELIPNGDAVHFAELLDIVPNLQQTTRCAVRWPGHAELWKKLTELDFLSDEPIEGLPYRLTTHEFMNAHLAPKLQYKRDECDVVAMRNIIIGVKNGEQTKITYDLLDMQI